MACQWTLLRTDAIHYCRWRFATVNYTSRARRIRRRHHASIKWKGCPPDHRWRKSLMCRKPSWTSGWRRRDGRWYAWTRVRRPRRRLVDDNEVGVDSELVAAVPNGRTRFGFVVHRQSCRCRHEDVAVSRDTGWRRRRHWSRVVIQTVCDHVGLSTDYRAVLTHLCP